MYRVLFRFEAFKSFKDCEHRGKYRETAAQFLLAPANAINSTKGLRMFTG